MKFPTLRVFRISVTPTFPSILKFLVIILSNLSPIKEKSSKNSKQKWKNKKSWERSPIRIKYEKKNCSISQPIERNNKLAPCHGNHLQNARPRREIGAKRRQADEMRRGKAGRVFPDSNINPPITYRGWQTSAVNPTKTRSIEGQRTRAGSHPSRPTNLSPRLAACTRKVSRRAFLRICENWFRHPRVHALRVRAKARRRAIYFASRLFHENPFEVNMCI